MFYAIFDFTAGPGNPGYGFANTKKAVAFSSRKNRDDFLLVRQKWDYSACAITRRQALKMLEPVYITGNWGLGLDPYCITGRYDDMVVIKKSKF